MSQFQQDQIYRFLKIFPYPFINRLDRRLYIKHPELDFVTQTKLGIYCGAVGYWVGKFLGRRQLLFATLFFLPPVLRVFYYEFKLSKQLSVQQGSPKLLKQADLVKRSEKNEFVAKKVLPSPKDLILRKVPQMSSKLTCSREFINTLTNDYFS